MLDSLKAASVPIAFTTASAARSSAFCMMFMKIISSNGSMSSFSRSEAKASTKVEELLLASTISVAFVARCGRLPRRMSLTRLAAWNSRSAMLNIFMASTGTAPELTCSTTLPLIGTFSLMARVAACGMPPATWRGSLSQSVRTCRIPQTSAMPPSSIRLNSSLRAWFKDAA